MAYSISLAGCASSRLQIGFDLTFNFSFVPHSPTLFSRPKMIADVSTNPQEAVFFSDPFVLSTLYYSKPTSHRKSPLKSYFFPWLNRQAWKTPLSHYRRYKFTKIHQFDTKVPLTVNPMLVVATFCKQSNTLHCSLETKAVFCMCLELAPDPAGCAMSERQVLCILQTAACAVGDVQRRCYKVQKNFSLFKRS